MRQILCLLLVISFSRTFVNAQLAPNCPPCYANQEPFEYWRFGSEAGRQILRVAIDTNGMNATQIEGATLGLGGAMAMWNNATGSNGTDKIPYKLQSHVLFTINEADFVVRVGAPAGGCASINLGVIPHVITISPDSLEDKSIAELSADIAHELGHRMGLENRSAGGPACLEAATIMGGVDPVTCISSPTAT